jgi:hypothetical protein
VGIYAFWTFLMRFMPHMREYSGRALLFGCMLLGSVMIIAMSAWLNASALAGSAAIQQHLAINLQNYTRDLERAHSNALAAQGLLPDIQLASTRFARLADAERTGSLTGTAGSGTVVQLLTQMSNQLSGLAQEVTQSADRVKALFEQGGKHLAKMRELISDRGPINERSDAFAAESMALTGVISSLQQTSVAPAVKRAADGLGTGFIAPAAGGRTPDLAERQTEVVGRVGAAVTAQAAQLSAAADKILAVQPVEPARFQAISTAEAVVRYASDFIPSWAGAISIDLMPAVLVLILCVVHASIRREGAPEMDANSMTVAELLTAQRLARAVEAAGPVPAAAAVPVLPVVEVPAETPEPATTPVRTEEAIAPRRDGDENVTPLVSARAKKD